MSDGTTPEIKQRFEIKLTLIRHGAAKSNLEHRYLGTTDEPLSAEGKQALFIKKESGLYPNPDKLFISPMLRCRQTAEILFPDVASWEIPEWTEMDFGQFECKNYKELNGNTAYQAWIDSEGELPFPDGESREHFRERVLRGFRKFLADVRKGNSPHIVPETVAVVHGGTIMALCSVLFGGGYFDYQRKCGEGYFCHFLYTDDKITLLELKHLC